MRHYARNIGDLAAATRGLDLLHRGAYDALLDAYYLREAPLPLDRRECYLLADARTPAERRAVDAVIARFFTESPDGWRQKRCDAELARWAAKSEGARDAINLRWQREREARRSVEQQETDARTTNVIRTYNDRNTNSIPPTNHEPQPIKAKTTKPRAAASPLPDWLPPEAWEGWRKHRGRKLTDRAVELQIAKLDALRAQGHDPGQLIALAIESGWATFYPPRSPPNGARQDRREAAGAAMFDPVRTDDGRPNETDPRDITAEATRVA